MNKVFDHTKYEKDIYTLWEKSNAFTPKIDKGKEPFCIIMPPPNANADLHVGHARFIAIEDILTRYYRLKGKSTLWLPGVDHAGIETQYVFEKKLKEESKSRSDFDRSTLYQMIWDYVQGNKSKMENQLRALGASCDWSRNQFTLDPKIIKIVYQTFKRLSDDGLVYRGERIVNYCPRCGTNYSQLEVDTKEQEDNLYYLDYGTIQIATTRPETIFADVAVCVNPKDKRYEKLIGENATIPLINREVPIISDNLVEIGFGTGALKITPMHDEVDFAIGQKHQLTAVSVIDDKGRMINTPTKYIGMKVMEARDAVVNDLQTSNKIIKIEKIKHLVGICYKDKGQIEPMVSKQWFIKVKPLAKQALEAINNKQVKFAAPRFAKIAKHWLTNLKDWNISRQIVWGIQIPAFKCNQCLNWTITEGETPNKCHCGHTKFTQDLDTFDTWFSSGQWPFATLMTTQKEDFDYFYPTSIMETAYDILPFWVIRMIMLGLYVTGKVPFENVIIHGLVRDKEGQKISKSKGNVINPLEMVAKYGSDALRMGMVWGTLIENDIALSEDNIRGLRNFGNKIWNIARFVSFINEDKKITSHTKPQVNNDDDKWIINQLGQTTKKVTIDLDHFRLSEAAEELYDFVWRKLADSYLEKIKDRKQEALPTLSYVLANTLVLLHPFMPFVTEVIYQSLFAKNNKDFLINTIWPN